LVLLFTGPQHLVMAYGYGVHFFIFSFSHFWNKVSLYSPGWLELAILQPQSPEC
jgi:hypothetical protein